MKPLAVAFAFLFVSSSLIAQDVRPIRDDVGYCWNAEQMKRLVDYLATTEKDTLGQNAFVAAVSPHDDYLYTARIYYPLFRSIRSREIVIFGVTHRTVQNEIGDPQGILLFDEHKAWTGCGKPVEISSLREFIKSRLDTQYFKVSNKAHQLEHSIEAMVPWLQYFNPEVKITPIMVTAMSFERMDAVSEKLGAAVAEYVVKARLVPGRDIFFLCSSDANHYGKDFDNIPFGEDNDAHIKATEQDRQIANSCIIGKVQPTKIRNFTEKMNNVVWCGKYSIPFGLLTTERIIRKILGKELIGSLLRYSDSYTEGVLPLMQTGMGTTAPFSLKHWVGYVTVGFRAE